MMKRRNFYIGFGIGLIMSSLAIMLFDNPVANQEITPEQLEEAAKESNLILLSNQDIEQLKEQAKEEAINTLNEKNQESKVIYFAIQQGMNSSEIGDFLLETKIIDDKARFTSLLTRYDLTKKIRAGVYLYSEKMSIEQVIEEITLTLKEDW